MAKKIQETPTNLTREELSNLSRVTTDVFFFSLFCYVIHPVRGKVRFELYPVSYTHLTLPTRSDV